MKTFWIILLTLFMTHTSIAVINVVVPVPAPANTFFPNNSNTSSIVDAPQQSSTPTPPTAPPSPTKATHSKDYFETLFHEVNVAKKTPPTISSVKLHDKLAQDSLAYGILQKYPYLSIGSMTFRPLSRKAIHRAEIQRGQELLLDNFEDNNLNYKELTELIDQKITDSKSSITDKDWVLMSNAARTLKTPESSHKAHLLGSFLAEYILLAEIKKQESKENLMPFDDSFLSALYYDLAQLYQSMYKNDENIFREEKSGTLALPINSIYQNDLSGEYQNEYPVPFSKLVSRRLDLLENAILLDPDDDLPWAQLIDFAAFDLVNSEFYDQLFPGFWEDYFPFGFNRHHAEELRHKWRQIHHHHAVRNHPNIRVNSLTGSRALRRLLNVHALPTSLLNLTIARTTSRPEAIVSGTQKSDSALLVLKKSPKRLPLSINITKHKRYKQIDTSYHPERATSPYTPHGPNLSRYNAPRHTAFPHHATTSRPSSFW